MTSSKSEKDDSNDVENDADADDEMRFKASEESAHIVVAPRWSTRVFAAESLQRIIHACEGKSTHFDLALARESKMRNNKGKNFIVFPHTFIFFFDLTVTERYFNIVGSKDFFGGEGGD